MKKSQIGLEYLLVVGLVVFAISSILIIALYYSNTSKDTLAISQIEAYALKIISSAESVFYSGEPSRATITVSLPEKVSSLEIVDNNIVISYNANSGINKRAFESNVPISGSLSFGYGLHKVKLEATEEGVLISDA